MVFFSTDSRFGRRLGLSGFWDPSAFGPGVGEVIACGPEEEVGGVAAWWVIAGVAEFESGEEWAVGDGESYAVGPELFPAEVKFAVPAWRAFPALPFPADVWAGYGDFGPEAFDGGVGEVHENPLDLRWSLWRPVLWL